MGRKFQYTTLDRVLSKLYRDLGLEEISETDVVEWCGEALNFMETPSILEEAVAFVEIKNHMAELPIGLQSIIQIARNVNWTKDQNKFCPANVLLDTNNIESVDSSAGELKAPVPLDCNGTPLSDYDLAYYRPYFDLQYEYNGWTDSNYYQQDYVPMRLANHSFFNSLVCPEDENIYAQDNTYDGGLSEYTISDNMLKTSFKEGSVAIAYYRQKLDPITGYPMIPEDVSFTTAITKYITMMYMSRMWYMGREGYSDKMQKAEADWQWYCKQASNKAFTLHGVDEHQNLLEQRNHLIPKINRYYGFFGNLGRAEDRSYFNRHEAPGRKRHEDNSDSSEINSTVIVNNDNSTTLNDSWDNVEW